jgi:3-phenylpropionate/cinnamic acid dioxygenase small subunit
MSMTYASFEVRARVEALHAVYAHALDDDRLEQWPELFLENGRYRVTTAENHERGFPLSLLCADSRAMMRDRVNSLRHANIYEGQRYRHQIGATLIDRIEAGIAYVRSTFMVLRVMQTGETLCFASGRYLDQISVEGADTRFQERLVICDSRRFDTLLAIPL